MPRAARFIEDNGFYHIISRSTNDSYIINDDDDFVCLTKIIYDAKKEYPFKLYHYVIMNSHFHFILQAYSHKMLSLALSYIKWHYTLWSKRRYGWKGPLWRERYKSIPIENEHYLFNCGMYIEHNPVRANLCDNPGKYKYSSYSKYHLGTTDKLIDNYSADIVNDNYAGIDYGSELAKNLFSRSYAIGSTMYIGKLSWLSHDCPE